MLINKYIMNMQNSSLVVGKFEENQLSQPWRAVQLLSSLILAVSQWWPL